MEETQYEVVPTGPAGAPGAHRSPEHYGDDPAEVEHNAIYQSPRKQQTWPGQQRNEVAAYDSPWQPVCWVYLCFAYTIAYIGGVVALTLMWKHAPVLTLLAAIVPTLVVFAVLRYIQKQYVTFALLVEMFWLGVIGAIPTAFVESGIAWLSVRHWKDNRDAGVMFAVAILNAFIIAALIEECFKYLCISRVVREGRMENVWYRHPNKPYGTILCGCAAALGFATLENILYVWADLAIQTAVLRAVLAVPGHCAGGVIIAVGFCEKVFYGKDTNMFWIVLPSVLFHGFYDWFLMASVIGYLDGQETGDALALAGLVCAMLTDIVQYLYMFRRLNLLDELEASAGPDDNKSLN